MIAECFQGAVLVKCIYMYYCDQEVNFHSTYALLALNYCIQGLAIHEYHYKEEDVRF